MRTRRTILLFALLQAVLGLWTCACGDTTNGRCEKDQDCPDGQVCRDGRCEEEPCEASCTVAGDCQGDCMDCIRGCCRNIECASNADCPEDNFGPRYCPDEPDPGSGCRVCSYVRCETDEECADPDFPLHRDCGQNESLVCDRGNCVCEQPCGGQCPDGQFCCLANNMCQPVPDPCADVDCPDCEQVNPEPGGELNAQTCQVEGADCSCVPLADLEPAFAGLHSAIDLDAQGVPVLSGYYGAPYGDLLYGVADSAAAGASVSWTFVDGVPPDAPCEGNVAGPRGGIAEPGDDVGWNSDIAVDGDGNPRISYHDRTHGGLKYAAFDTVTWLSHVVDEVGTTGRYTSMKLDAAGRPIIAYMTVYQEQTSRLKVAWADTPDPIAAEDWTIYEVDRVSVPCLPGTCQENEACLEVSGVCTVVDDPANCNGGSGCQDEEVCVAGACEALMPASSLDDLPVGVGLFASLDLFGDGSPAVVYYDSVNGNLKAVTWDANANAFGTPWIIAGESTSGEDLGDLGADCSLSIDGDDVMHVVFQDADLGQLLYWSSTLASLELVDAGARDADGNPTDLANAVGGLHWVGNFAKVVVDPDGNARVAYQDGTSLDLLVAVRQPAGLWTVEILARKLGEDQFIGAYGFFVDQVLGTQAGVVHISNFRHNLRTDPWSSAIDLRTHTHP